MVKNLPTNTGGTIDSSLMPGLGRSPGGGNGTPLPIFLSGKFYGQRSLAGYIQSWGHKESTELSAYIHMWL